MWKPSLGLCSRLIPESAWFVIMRAVFMDREERLMWSDHPNEECGVFGIYAPGEDVARLTFFGLYALQHRGQESAGIAVADGRTIRAHKDMGLVAQVFDEAKLAPLQGDFAIGHTRYSTTGSSKISNAQPFTLESYLGPLALAHNGNLTNAAELRLELLRRGAGLTSTSEYGARSITSSTSKPAACR